MEGAHQQPDDEQRDEGTTPTEGLAASANHPDTNSGHEARPTEGPRIYAACLADYHAGILHGRWIDATLGPEEMQAAIDEMLATRPATRRWGEVAEEWAIHDYDGFGRFVDIDEHEPLDVIHRLAHGVASYGEAFGAWTEIVGVNDDEGIDQFEEFFIGEYGSLEEFGEQQLEDMGFDFSELPGVPEGLRPYVQVDMAGWVRDMELEGAIASRESQTGMYVFWNYQ